MAIPEINANSIISIHSLETINESTKSTIAKPVNKRNLVLTYPSLYNTNIREKKAKAEPASGWSKTKITGNRTMDAAMSSEFKFGFLLDCVFKYTASNRQVANLPNSEGCSLKLPIAIQAWFPPTFLPINNTAMSSMVTKIYIKGAVEIKKR